MVKSVKYCEYKLNNKMLAAFFCFLFVLLFGSEVLASTKWQTTEIEKTSIANNSISIDIDNSNKSYICYFSSNSQSINLALLINNVWRTESVYTSKSNLNRPIVKIDTGNIPHIVFNESNSIIHAWQKENKWHFEKISDNGNIDNSHAFAIGPDNSIHIVYLNLKTNNLTYFYKSDLINSREIINPLENDCSVSSITIGNDASVHISYYNWLEKTLKYANRKDGEWHLKIIAPNLKFCSSNIIIIRSGSPIIMFDDFKSQHLCIAYLNNDSWVVEKVVFAAEGFALSDSPTSIFSFIFVQQIDDESNNPKYELNVAFITDSTPFPGDWFVKRIKQHEFYPLISLGYVVDSFEKPHIIYWDMKSRSIVYVTRID